jgi:hypothetical protein
MNESDAAGAVAIAELEALVREDRFLADAGDERPTANSPRRLMRDAQYCGGARNVRATGSDAVGGRRAAP